MLVDTNNQTIDVMTKDLPGRPVERPASAFRAEGGLKVNQVSRNAQMERMDADMNKKPAAAALPSLCSDNGGVNRLKRKHRDEEDWEDSSEDAEEESAIIRKVGSKRSRPTEVHNLTERKRRGKINEKMRALQDLIPYCNKVDKAAMLDEAIEYLRVLQLQVQMMSMRAQMCALPMMAQPGLQHPYTTAPSSQYLPLGMGYQAGALDMTTGFPAQAACFPGQFKPPPIFWNAAQGLPTSMPGLLVPMPGAPPAPAPGSADETPNSKDPLHEEAV
uniref:BHLH domain-containing protein n=1 Tax=Kalanchoe fedtschenkoi TaxID=63787 RepID=A0A7N0UM46_KALFE